ncbi:MAG: Gfo/Idh/MocA family protein [Terriglobia bacterium]
MPDRPQLNRREFLKTGVAGGSGMAALGGVSFITRPERVFGANDRVRVAICGLHGRGMDHVQNYRKIPNAEIAAVCDVDENVLRQRLAEIERMGVPKPVSYIDVRKLLDDKSIDAISVATQNHWHSLMGIWACQAGKDAYIEKPCCHNIWEGRQLVLASKRYGRIVQHGTQLRSAPALREGVQKLHQGMLGDLYMARGLCFKWRNTIGRAPVEPVPPGVHYDLWTGPAPVHAFTKNRFHYNWHWFWWYGNGDLGNQGIHQVDIARWGLGVRFPNKVSAIGGHFMFDDDQETPNDLSCAFEFDLPEGKRRMMTFEVRHWMTNNEAEVGTPALGAPMPRHSAGPASGSRDTIGDMFYGSKGYMTTGDEDAQTYKVWLGEERAPQPSVHTGNDELAHFTNFIDCVISRKQENLNAPIEEGYISCALVHLANASYRLGRTIDFNPETQAVIGDPEADLLVRDGDRGYRAPFVVPEEV